MPTQNKVSHKETHPPAPSCTQNGLSIEETSVTKVAGGTLAREVRWASWGGGDGGGTCEICSWGVGGSGGWSRAPSRNMNLKRCLEFRHFSVGMWGRKSPFNQKGDPGICHLFH